MIDDVAMGCSFKKLQSFPGDSSSIDPEASHVDALRRLGLHISPWFSCWLAHSRRSSSPPVHILRCGCVL
jgi:hypothetical protein